MLAPTSYTAPESVAVGGGGGSGVGSGGEPLRYGFTSRGFAFLQSWNDASYTYSILQLNLGSNPISKLEVASALNTLNLGRAMFYYGYDINTKKYNPRVYLGTPTTSAYSWNFDQQTGINHPSIWPEVKPQKGEANIFVYLYLIYAIIINAIARSSFRTRSGSEDSSLKI